MLSRAEILIINEIISGIYTEKDFEKMRTDLLEKCRSVIPYVSSSFYMASAEKKSLLASPVSVGLTKEQLDRYIREYEDKDYSRWIFMSGKSMVYRESELFSYDSRENEIYYREIYEPANLYHSLQASIAHNGNFLGVISLYRVKGQEDFNDKEAFILSLLLGHLENRTVKELIKSGGEETVRSRAYFDAYHFIDTYGLTSREVEILALLMAGLKTETICEKLSITENTLKKHSLNIYKKLGISKRWELIRFA